MTCTGRELDATMEAALAAMSEAFAKMDVEPAVLATEKALTKVGEAKGAYEAAVIEKGGESEAANVAKQGVIQAARQAAEQEENLKKVVEAVGAEANVPVAEVHKDLVNRFNAKESARIMGLFKAAQTLDLLFVIDATGSMHMVFDAVSECLRGIIVDLQGELKHLQHQVGMVAYRDVCDGPLRFTISPFSGSVSTVEKAMTSTEKGGELLVCGGGDIAEDVVGGLDKANEQSWKYVNKVLILCGDAPCHGTQYHDIESDDYPHGVPGSKPSAEVIEALKGKGIQATFLRINSSTDKMIAKFNEEAGYTLFHTADLNLGAHLDAQGQLKESAPSGVIKDAIKRSVKDSLSRSMSKSQSMMSSLSKKGGLACPTAMARLGNTLGCITENLATAVGSDWQEMHAENGEKWYWNKSTDETTWDVPDELNY